MKKGDIRGLSTVIATLLIILLVIISVTIVWGVVRSIIKNNSDSISTGKFTINLEIVPPIKQDSNSVTIKVKRNAGEGELDGIRFVIFDGQNSHIFDKDANLDPLEMGTFVLPYNGTIVSISISPSFLTESGKAMIGSVSDTYHGTIEQQGNTPAQNCTPSCSGKDCGDDGCFGDCGNCAEGSEECILQQCVTTEEPCVPDICSESICAANTCEGESCSDGCEGSCSGILEPDCIDASENQIECGPSENECLNCGTCQGGNLWCDDGKCCEIGEHKSPLGGSCETDCNVTLNCLNKQCGDNGCPGDGTCLPYGDCKSDPFNSSYSCNASFMCEMCTGNCGIKECGPVPNGCGESCGNCTISYNSSYNCNASFMCEMCLPNCGTRECGTAPFIPNGCRESCGNCTEKYGYPENLCTAEGTCIPPEMSLNTGTITSVYPEPGHNLITGSNLPGYGEDEEEAELENARSIKIIGLYESCYQIIPIWVHYPESAGQPTVVQVSVFIVPIEVGYSYEIWESLDCGS